MASLISDVESSSEMDVDSASQVDYTSLLEESEVSQLERLDMDETRVMLNSMIETCEELNQKPSFQRDEDVELVKQVNQGRIIFETQFGHNFKKPQTPVKKGMNQSRAKSPDISDGVQSGPSRRSFKSAKMSLASQSTRLSQSQESSINVDAKPSDLLLLFKHTKLCTAVFLKRVARMGGQENIFSVESYLALQKSWGIDEETGNYSVLHVFKKQGQDTAYAFNTLPGTPCFMGAFSQNEYVAECKERELKVEAEKEKLNPKPRNKSMRFDKNVTAHEQLEGSQTPANANQAPGGKETHAHRRLLVELCKENRQKEVGLIDFFVNKESVYECMRNIFSTSFCIRDGSMALDASNSLSDMKISPSSVKKQIDPENDLNARSQCIVSFTAKELRQLQEMAEGETAIPLQSNSTLNQTNVTNS